MVTSFAVVVHRATLVAPDRIEILEIDLNILINYCKGDYVEKIVRYADYMFTINPEVHKFIGRVFWNNDLKEQALFFLHRAKDYFFHDPELHFLIALTCLDSDDIGGAIKSLEDCITILPGYFPAQNLLNNKAVVINFSRMEDSSARRIVDFITGTVYALNGEIQRIGDKIFLATPPKFVTDGKISDLVDKKDNLS